MSIHGHTVDCTKADTSYQLHIQDIAIFKEHNSTKLEKWLANIERAAEFTSES